MNIKIKETGEVNTLSIRDRRSGTDRTQDLIGNAGAMSDGQFAWSEDDDAYLADQETFAWWDQYITDYETTQDEIETLAERLGVDASEIRQQVEAATGYDYGNHRREAVEAMKEMES